MLRHYGSRCVSLICLALAVRTFAVQGFLAPVVVQGDSMAPWAMGTALQMRCEECSHSLGVDPSQVLLDATYPCLACGAHTVAATGARRPPQRLWIDRTRSMPDRWQVVVFRSPLDASSLSLKRVVGLPGEAVSFRGGDLHVDGRRVVKPAPVQFQLRRLEHAERVGAQRWQPSGDACRWTDGRWLLRATGEPALPTLRYTAPVYDDLPQNLGLSRRYQAQPDVMIAVCPKASPDAVLSVSCHGVTAQLQFALGEARLSASQAPAARGHWTTPVETVVLSVFDKTPVLIVNGQVVARLPTREHDTPANPQIECRVGRVSCGELTLWKDVYYEAAPQAHGALGDQPWRLGADEYFVVGDNQALSLDSRTWAAAPGLPGRLIVGRAVRRQP